MTFKLRFKNKTIYTMCAFMTISAVGLTGCLNSNNDAKKQDSKIEMSESKKISEVKKGVKENNNHEVKDDSIDKKVVNQSNKKCSARFLKKKITDDPKFNTEIKANKSNTIKACIEGLGPDAEEEGVGYIYIKNLKTNERYAFTIVQKQQKNTPKHVEWFDDNNLMVIVGSCNGTVAKGGNLYKVNINTGVTTEIYNTKNNRKQVISVKRNKDKLQLEMLVYDDEFINSHKEKKDIIIK